MTEAPPVRCKASAQPPPPAMQHSDGDRGASSAVQSLSNAADAGDATLTTKKRLTEAPDAI